MIDGQMQLQMRLQQLNRMCAVGIALTVTALTVSYGKCVAGWPDSEVMCAAPWIA